MRVLNGDDSGFRDNFYWKFTFYAGRMGSAVAQLLITLLSCGFLSPITWVWAIIDIITVKTDGEGRPFTEG